MSGIVHDSKNNRMLASGISTPISIIDVDDGTCVEGLKKEGEKPGSLKNPWQIGLHPPSNNILVAEVHNNRIQMLTEKFEHVSLIGDKQLSMPHAMSCSLLSPHPIVTADGHS